MKTSTTSPNLWLLGATFETANMGVNALAESSLKCIFTHWPDAHVTLRAQYHEETQTITLLGREFTIHRIGLRLNRNVFRSNHLYKLLFQALLLKIFPFGWLRRRLEAWNPYLKQLLDTDLALDITAGDSFSDIYGTRKFILNALPKLLFLWCGTKLILLPQTYGPFYSPFAQRFARYLLARATVIYSRDRQSIEDIKTLLGTRANLKILKFVPDVAFTLDAEKPEIPLILQLAQLKSQGHTVIGLNVSGLVYNGGLEAQQRFGIRDDYRVLMEKLVQHFLATPNHVLVLVSHVFSEKTAESDPLACQSLYEKLKNHYPDRLLLLQETLNHRQVKYLIGQCDFFLGTRMHACIAALSQNVPAVGLAYSQKFKGVFDSVGLGDAVIDLRSNCNEEVSKQLQEVFDRRYEVAERLRSRIPGIQKEVIELFEGMTI